MSGITALLIPARRKQRAKIALVEGEGIQWECNLKEKTAEKVETPKCINQPKSQSHCSGLGCLNQSPGTRSFVKRGLG